MAAIAGKVGAIYQNYSGTDKSKLIADFQDDETWTSGAGTQTDDGTNYRLGTESIKITDDDASSGLLYSDQNSVSLNINQFRSGAASDSSDYIYMIFYVSDATKVTNVQLGFDADATYDGTNVYTYSITTVVSGWNYVKIKKSAFSSSGSPDWAATQSIRVGWTSTASAQDEYVSFQAIYLIDDSYDLTLANNTAYIMEELGLFFNWSLDFSQDMNEITDFSNAGWKSFLPTLKDFTVSAEKYWANGDYLDNIGDDFILALYVNESSGYKYDVITKLSSDSIETSVDNIVSETIEFKGTGEPYYSDVQIIDS